MRSGGSIITFICYVVFNILKISSNNIYKNKKLYNVVVLIAQLPRVLQPVEGFNTRQTRQTLTLTRANPYPSQRVRVLRVRVRVAWENPRVTRDNH